MSRFCKVKVALLGLLLAACAITPVATQAAGSAGATVSITATVDTFAEWSTATPAIIDSDWDGHITAVNQTRTVTKALTLFTNGDTTITPTAGVNSGILTAGGQTLTTSYKLTGEVTVPNVTFLPADATAGDFFDSANTYTVHHTAGDGSYTLNLVAQAVSPATAPDAGTYTCGVILTASW